MDMSKYQAAAMKTAVYPGRGSVDGLCYAVLGLVGEAGELANKVKKILRDAGGELSDSSRDDMAAELGDVLWYVAAVASELTHSLDAVALANLAKLADRKQRGSIQGEGDNR